MIRIEDIFAGQNVRYLPTANEYRMTCVFREKHSVGSDGKNSLVVTPDINAYHCFSCGAHGSLVKLLTGKMGVSFFDALELVSLTNIEHVFKDTTRKEGTFEADFILNLKSPKALLDRGFSPRSLKRHKVSTLDMYSKKHETVMQYMAIPWYYQKRLVAVKVRLGRDFYWVPGKFEKSRYLYNYDAVAGKHKDIYLTEGETDVYQTEKNGTMNVVATGGGGFSFEQAMLCKDFDNIFLAFDNDEAGLKNIEIANALLATHTRNIYIINYESEDPGKCTRDEWQKSIAEPQTYLEFSMNMAVEMGDEYLDKKESWLKKFNYDRK